MLENPLPHARLGPTAEAAMDSDSVAEALRQIPPWEARTEAIQHGLDEQTIVPGRHAHMAYPARQQVVNTLPLIVAKAITSHGPAFYTLTRYESRFRPIRNPLNDVTP